MTSYYILDIDTDKRFKLSTWHMILARMSLPISFVIYGLLVSLGLQIGGMTAKSGFLVLAIFYVLDLFLWFANTYSPTKIIIAFLVFIFWNSVIREIISEYNITLKGLNPRLIGELLHLYKSTARNKILAL